MLQIESEESDPFRSVNSVVMLEKHPYQKRPAGFPAGRWRLWLQVGPVRLRLGGLSGSYIERSLFSLL